MSYLEAENETPDAIIALGSAPFSLLASGVVVAGTTEYPEGGAATRWTPGCPLTAGGVLLEPSGAVALDSEYRGYHISSALGIVRTPRLVPPQTVRAPAPPPRRGAPIPSAISAATLRKARRARAFLRAVPESTYVIEDDPTDEL